MRLGNREDLARPIKYPREIRTAAAINAAASAKSKSDQAVVDFPTCSQLSNMSVVDILTTWHA